MLIKFQSKAIAPFSMLADDAKLLLACMGMSTDLKGSISGANLREAQSQLEAALKRTAAPAGRETDPANGEDDDEEPPVNLSVRAVPLLNMLRKAQTGNSYVMWHP